MQTITLCKQSYVLRLATEVDVVEIRQLLNLAYQELMEIGLNYVACTQDEEKTRERMAEGRTFVLILESEIVATILFSTKNYFTNKKTAYVGQFAVSPELKKQGLGSMLMDYCEELAQIEGFQGVQLDTAKPAHHLVDWYLSRDYKIVGEIHVDGRNYDSFIFEKLFC